MYVISQNLYLEVKEILNRIHIPFSIRVKKYESLFGFSYQGWYEIAKDKRDNYYWRYNNQRYKKIPKEKYQKLKKFFDIIVDGDSECFRSKPSINNLKLYQLLMS